MAAGHQEEAVGMLEDSELLSLCTLTLLSLLYACPVFGACCLIGHSFQGFPCQQVDCGGADGAESRG